MKHLHAIDRWMTHWMKRYGIALLRISLGIVFLWFGILKFFPNLSPAESLAQQTIRVITFDLVPPETGIRVLAAWECAIGIGLLVERWMRLVLLALGIQMLGAMSPMFLFPEQIFMHVPFVPTLEGQYIIKNLVLISAAIVLGATVDRPRENKIPNDDPGST